MLHPPPIAASTVALQPCRSRPICASTQGWAKSRMVSINQGLPIPQSLLGKTMRLWTARRSLAQSRTACVSTVSRLLRLPRWAGTSTSISSRRSQMESMILRKSGASAAPLPGDRRDLRTNTGKIMSILRARNLKPPHRRILTRAPAPVRTVHTMGRGIFSICPLGRQPA